MDILLFEDNLYTAEMIKEDIEYYFSKKTVNIKICNTIYEANEAISENVFDYIITDLNMNPEGLDECYLDETLGAIITGWVWVKHMLLNTNYCDPSRIIFYSAFCEELLRNDEYKSQYEKNILLIPKTEDGDNILELCG